MTSGHLKKSTAMENTPDNCWWNHEFIFLVLLRKKIITSHFFFVNKPYQSTVQSILPDCKLMNRNAPNHRLCSATCLEYTIAALFTAETKKMQLRWSLVLFLDKRKVYTLINTVPNRSGFFSTILYSVLCAKDI